MHQKSEIHSHLVLQQVFYLSVLIFFIEKKDRTLRPGYNTRKQQPTATKKVMAKLMDSNHYKVYTYLEYKKSATFR